MTVERSAGVVVDVSIPTGAFELGGILRPPPGTEIELAEFVPVGDEVVPYLWIDGDPERFRQFERQVRNDERVDDLRSVDTQAGRRLVRLDWNRSPDGFLDACLVDEAMIQHGWGTHARWTFQLRFMDQNALTRFHRRCAEEGVPLTVHRITNAGGVDGPDPYGLTDSQREALLLALEEGYFDDPRAVTLAELGEELDITRQAVSYRIRAGVRQLIDAALRDRELPT